MNTEKKQSLESLSTAQLTQLLLHMDQQPEEKIQAAIDILRGRGVDSDETLREARIQQCSTCLLRQMDMKQGLVCSTTGERGSFVGKCAQYECDQKAEKAEIAESRKSSVNASLLLKIYQAYLVVALIVYAINFFGVQMTMSFFSSFGYQAERWPVLLMLAGILAIFLYYTNVIVAVSSRRTGMMKLAYIQCSIAIVYQLFTGIAGLAMGTVYPGSILGLIVKVTIPIGAIALLSTVQASPEIDKSKSRLEKADIAIMVISIVGVILGIVGRFMFLYSLY